jgi:hypothetical protein
MLVRRMVLKYTTVYVEFHYTHVFKEIIISWMNKTFDTDCATTNTETQAIMNFACS